MFKQLTAAVLTVAIFTTSAFAGIGGNSAAYRGGTIAVKEGTEAKFSLQGDHFTFQPGKKGAVAIPYENIQTLEYGQKAGRRIGAAVGLTILAGPLGLLALMSKKRRHMVSLTWTNAQGKTDAAVFEFGKDSIRAALNSLSARSGKEVEYESEDAKQNLGR
jgi:hypothetical protein